MKEKKLEVLEAERLVLTVELRNRLLKEATRLLPRAIEQARRDRPALLRMIVRLAMRPTDVDRRHAGR